MTIRSRSKKGSSKCASTPINKETSKTFKPVAIRAPQQSYRLGTFDAVPVAVLQIIQEYLSPFDYRQLLNTNARIFQHAKFETVYYNFISSDHKMKGFKKKEQKDYLLDFSSRAIQNRSQQVAIKFHHPSLEYFQEFEHALPGIDKLRLVDSNAGNFWKSATTLLNMNCFMNIRHLIFQNVETLEHLSGLSGVKILEIHQSHSLVSIAPIASLERLVLDHCYELKEIADFHSVPELSITNCWKLGFTNLGNHQKVKLSHTAHVGHNPDYSVFAKVPYLSISSATFPKTVNDLSLFNEVEYLEINGNGREISAAGLTSNRFLGLHYCSLEWSDPFTRLETAELYHCKIFEMKPLSIVQNLRLTSCEGEIDLSILKNLRKITLEDLPQITNVNMLANLEEVTLINCKNITDISALGEVKKLSIIGCDSIVSLAGLGRGNVEVMISTSNISDFSPLESVTKVSLEYCFQLKSTKALSKVQHLSISHCEYLNEIASVGASSLKSLLLHDCHKVKSLADLLSASSSSSLTSLHLERCNGIQEVMSMTKTSGISRLQRLVINYCEALHQQMKGDKNKSCEKFFQSIPYVRINQEGLLPAKGVESYLPNLFSL